MSRLKLTLTLSLSLTAITATAAAEDQNPDVPRGGLAIEMGVGHADGLQQASYTDRYGDGGSLGLRRVKGDSLQKYSLKVLLPVSSKITATLSYDRLDSTVKYLGSGTSENKEGVNMVSMSIRFYLGGKSK